jgi:hypothetical protein
MTLIYSAHVILNINDIFSSGIIIDHLGKMLSSADCIC